LGTAIGSSLPYAVAAALSPIPITALTLILIGHHGVAGGLFAAGRVLSYALVLTILIIGAELFNAGTDAAPSALGVAVRIALGAVAIGAGVWTWVGRSSERKAPAPTRWMQAVSGMRPSRAGALGVALSSGPKSLVLLAGGGLTIAGARLDIAGEALAGVIFLGVATSTVLLPVVLYYVLGARSLSTFRSLQDWMQTNNAGIGAVLLILVGVVLIGSGISGL